MYDLVYVIVTTGVGPICAWYHSVYLMAATISMMTRGQGHTRIPVWVIWVTAVPNGSIVMLLLSG